MRAAEKEKERRRGEEQAEEGRGAGGRAANTAAARKRRLHEQQMGFGTALPGSVPSLLREMMDRGLLQGGELEEGGTSTVSAVPLVLCDIGAGCGNILSDVADSDVLSTPVHSGGGQGTQLWGVEMNLELCRSEKLASSIVHVILPLLLVC